MSGSQNNEWQVYVVEVLGVEPNGFYVGQSWHSPEVRRQQHVDGIKAARIFRRPGVHVGRLRPDLVPPLPSLLNKECAEAAEKLVAAILRQQGQSVYGGH